MAGPRINGEPKSAVVAVHLEPSLETMLSAITSNRGLFLHDLLVRELLHTGRLTPAEWLRITTGLE